MADIKTNDMFLPRRTGAAKDCWELEQNPA